MRHRWCWRFSQRPMTQVKGLCLASTAILFSCKGIQLWLHRLTHRAVLTRRPSLPSMAEPLPSKERVTDREHFTRKRFLFRNPAHVQLGRRVVVEPSLSGVPECLSLHEQVYHQDTSLSREVPLEATGTKRKEAAFLPVWDTGTPAAMC